MLTKEDLKKIEELLQPKFDHIELRLDEHDKRFEAIEKKLEEHDKRFEAIDRRFGVIDKKLGEHDDKFDQIFNALIDIDRRIENIVEAIATHTGMLKDITFRVIAIERYMKSNTQYTQNIDSEVGLLCERIHQLEEKTGTFSMLRDKSKDGGRYKYGKPRS